MGALAVLALLLLLSSGGGSSTQKPKSDPPPKKEPEPEPEDTTLKDLKTAADLVKTGLSIGLPIVAALGGGGAAAGSVGGTAGLVAGTEVTVHGGAGAGAIATGGGGGGAAAGGTTAALVGGSLEGALGASGIFLILIIIVICNEIAKGQADYKSFQMLVAQLQPSARAMHEFERFLCDIEVPAGQGSRWDVRDWRLDKILNGQSSVRFQGYRTVRTWIPRPGAGAQARRWRAMAWAYLRERSWRGSAINRNWTKLNLPLWAVRPGERDGALDYLQFNGVDAPPTGTPEEWGGLRRVPLMHGATLAPRVDKNSITSNPAEQIARVVDQDVSATECSELERKFARLCGLIDAILVFNADPTVYIVFDRVEYCDLMMMRLELTPEEAIKANWTISEDRSSAAPDHPLRTGFILPASVWGFTVRVDPELVKSGRMLGIEVLP